MYSKIENGVLTKFDERDLVNGHFNIPNSVKSIGESAFERCSNLTSITIPNSVKSIGESAFTGCSSLTSITIPDSVTSISDYVFLNCSNLTSITIPNSVKSISDSVFLNCSNLTSITLPNKVKSIGRYAFEGCSNLTSINIPDSVTSIGGGAFNYCSRLTSITISKSVTSISSSAFDCCPNLSSINVDAKNKTYCSIDGVLFSNNKKKIIFCPKVKTGSYTIPDSVKSISSYVFRDCSNLTSITIPDSVKSIGESTFVGCSSLTSITIPKRLVKDLKEVPPFTLIKTEDGQENYFGLINLDITGKVNTSKINKIMSNPAFKEQNNNDFFNLLFNLGFFEGKKSKITMHNDQGKEIEQPTSDVGFNILQKLFKEYVGLSVDSMHSYFKSMRPVGVNEEFLRFMSNKTNLNEIIEQEKEKKGFIARVLDWFEMRKSLNNLQEIEDTANMTNTPTSEENRYKVRTYSTAETGIDKIKWKEPTVALLAKEFKENKFQNVTNETQHIAAFLGTYSPYSEQKYFDKAVELDKERQENGTPDHILGEELKQSYTESFKEYMKKTEALREEILNEAGKTVESQADIADEVFTYEMLAKSDKANFVMGFLTSCCATLYGAGAGAMRAMIVDSRMQPIVIRNRKDEIVAFGILYVNKEQGYAVINDIEVNKKYQDDRARKAIYNKAVQGIEAFVTRYNEKFDIPIRQVNCGLSPNWTAVNDFVTQNPRGKILEAPNFDDFKYVGSGSWSGDWHSKQYVLWQEKGKGKGV